MFNRVCVIAKTSLFGTHGFLTEALGGLVTGRSTTSSAIHMGINYMATTTTIFGVANPPSPPTLSVAAYMPDSPNFLTNFLQMSGLTVLSIPAGLILHLLGLPAPISLPMQIINSLIGNAMIAGGIELARKFSLWEHPKVVASQNNLREQVYNYGLRS